MTFLIITHVVHKHVHGEYFAYGPYIKEMDIWLKYADKVLIIAPLLRGSLPDNIELQYHHPAIEFIPVQAFHIRSWKIALRSAFIVPGILWKIIKTIKKCDHVHIRCPGNMGLLGCIAQIFFPGKPKTAKYAGNWDNNDRKPWSYKLQKWLLNNRTITKRMQVMVYGNWPGNSKNILPFFTATYSETDGLKISPRNIRGDLQILFVGSLTPNKHPMVSCIAASQLLKKGVPIRLDLYGDGPERQRIESYVAGSGLQENIYLHGNQDAGVIKKAFQSAHFLVFVSGSEGWPKVVSEAMWWGCLPVTTAISCVPEMLGYGQRGELVKCDPEEVVDKIEWLIAQPPSYEAKCNAAMEWSRQFTLERFEKEIRHLIQR